MRKAPPKKQPGQARTPRRINGAFLDVASAAAKMGYSEKQVRGEVARGVLPHRWFGGRLVFLEEELTDFQQRLPGVTVDQALKNLAKRHPQEQHKE